MFICFGAPRPRFQFSILVSEAHSPSFLADVFSEEHKYSRVNFRCSRGLEELGTFTVRTLVCCLTGWDGTAPPGYRKPLQQTLLYSLPSHLIKNVLFSQNLESPDLRVWLQNSQFLLLSLFCTLVTIPPHFSNYTLETTTAFKKPCAASTSFRPLYINDDPFFLILKTLYITDDIPEFFEHFFRLFFFKRFCPIKVLQHCMFCLWTFESSQESVSSILVYTFLFIRLLPSYSSRLLAASATLLPAN